MIRHIFANIRKVHEGFDSDCLQRFGVTDTRIEEDMRRADGACR